MADFLLAELTGSGSAKPINTFDVFNIGGEVNYTASDGSVWLRTGYVDTDTNSYPLARKDFPSIIEEVSPADNDIYLSSSVDTTYYANDKLWVAFTNATYIEYDNTGAKTGRTLSSATTGVPQAITNDSEYLLVAGDVDDKISVFDEGLLTEVSVISLTPTKSMGISYMTYDFELDYIWCVRDDLTTIDSFTTAGSLVSSFSISATGNSCKGICAVGDRLYLVFDDGKIAKYDKDGNFLINTYDYAAANAPSGFDYNPTEGVGVALPKQSTTRRNISFLSTYVGLVTESTHTELNLPYYVRIA